MPEGTLIMLGYALFAIVGALVLARRLPRGARVIWITFGGLMGAALGTGLTFGRHRFADPELAPAWSWLGSIGFSDVLRVLETLTHHPPMLASAALFLAAMLIGMRTPLAPMLREALRRTFTVLGVCAALLVATVVLVIGNSPVDWAEGSWILLMLLPTIAVALGAWVFSPIRGMYWRLAAGGRMSSRFAASRSVPLGRAAPVAASAGAPSMMSSARSFFRESLRERGGIDLAVLDEAFTKSWQRETKLAEYGATPSGSGAALIGGSGRAAPGSRRRTTDPVARALGRDGPAFRRKVERVRRLAVLAVLALVVIGLAATWLLAG